MKNNTNLPKKYESQKKLAIELLAQIKPPTLEEVANKTGVTLDIVKKWNSDSEFINAKLDRFTVLAGNETQKVIMAVAREAKAGNIQACRLFLEWQQRLTKNVTVKFESPFEVFARRQEERHGDAEEVDFEEVAAELIDILPEDYEDLPPREEQKPIKRKKLEKSALKNAIDKEKYNNKQKEWYKWKKRAKLVGVPPLPPKRPTAQARNKWMKSILDSATPKQLKEWKKDDETT